MQASVILDLLRNAYKSNSLNQLKIIDGQLIEKKEEISSELLLGGRTARFAKKSQVSNQKLYQSLFVQALFPSYHSYRKFSILKIQKQHRLSKTVNLLALKILEIGEEKENHLWDAFLKIPEKERSKQMVERIAKLFGDQTDNIEEYQNFIRSIESVPSEEFSAFISAVLSYAGPVDEKEHSLSLGKAVELLHPAFVFRLNEKKKKEFSQLLFSLSDELRSGIVSQNLASLFALMSPDGKDLEIVRSLFDSLTQKKFLEIVSRLASCKKKSPLSFVLRFLKRFDKEKISLDSLDAVISVVQHLYDERQFNAVYQQICQIKREFRLQFFVDFSRLIEGEFDGWCLAGVLLAWYQLDLTRWTEGGIKKLFPLFKGLSEEIDREEIVEALRECSEDKRETVVFCTASWFYFHPLYQFRGDLLRAVALLPSFTPPQQEIEKIFRTFRDLNDEQIRKAVLRTATLIPNEQLTGEGFEWAASLLSQISKPERPDYFLEVFEKISIDKRLDVLEKTAYCCGKVSSAWAQTDILQLLAMLPDKHRTLSTATFLASVFSQVPDFTLRIDIAQALGYIKVEDRSLEILRGIAALLIGVENVDDRDEILEALNAVSDKKCSALLKVSFPNVFSKLEGWKRADVIYMLKDVPIADCSSDTIQNLSWLLEGVVDESDRLFLRDLPSFISLKFRREWICAATTALRAENLAKKKINILRTSVYFPSNLWEHFFDFALNYSKHDSCSHLLSQYFQMYRQQALSVYDNLYLRLSSITDREQAGSLALKIIEQREVFSRHLKQHSLLFTANLVKECAKQSSNRRNPYNLYAYLRKVWKSPLPKLVLPKHSYEGNHYILSFQGLQKLAKNQPVVRYEQLPQCPDPKIFFAEFEWRIKYFSKDELDKVLREVMSITTISYRILKINFLRDPYISMWQMRGEPKKKVPQAQVYFTEAMSSIAQKSSEVSKGELLSPREKALFMMIAGMQECSKGKMGALASIHYLLQKESNRKGATEKFENFEGKPALSYLAEVVAEIWEELLSSDNALLRELTGEQEKIEIRELVHQSIYLRNLVGKKIGLTGKSKPEFDLFSSVLYETLVEKKIKEVLSIFCKHMTPYCLVEKIQKKINEDLVPEKKLQVYNSINSLLSKENLYEIWEQDKELNPNGKIQIRGVWRLLIATGILQKSGLP